MTPEDIELAQIEEEVLVLGSQLAEAEEKLNHLRERLGRFRSLYLRHIGPRKARLDELEAQLAALVSARSPKDGDAAELAATAHRRSQESERVAGLDEAEQIVPSPPSADLRALFRRVARLAHPDLAANDEDSRHRTKVMSRANQAYAARDFDALARIELEESTPAPCGSEVGDRLVVAIRQRAAARSRLSMVEVEYCNIQSDPLTQLADRVDAAMACERDLLTEMASELDRRSAILQARLVRELEVR